MAAQLRQEPSRESPIIAELDQGTIVEREGKKVRRWVPVRHQERSGWVTDRVLEKVEGTEPDPDRVWTEAEIVQIIRGAARAFGQPEEDLLRVGLCESNLHPRGQSAGALVRALSVPPHYLGLDAPR
jgi:hypothetical protein